MSHFPGSAYVRRTSLPVSAVMLRLFALPLADNAGSIRVLEKVGYEREGLLRASCVKYGERRDQLLYACINADWNGALSDPEESS